MVKVKILLNSIELVKEFVEITNNYRFECDICEGRYVVDAKSIMGLFSFELEKPLELSIHNDNCTDYLEDIEKFIVRK